MKTNINVTRTEHPDVEVEIAIPETLPADQVGALAHTIWESIYEAVESNATTLSDKVDDGNDLPFTHDAPNYDALAFDVRAILFAQLTRLDKLAEEIPTTVPNGLCLVTGAMCALAQALLQ